jgi:hypothetical protein
LSLLNLPLFLLPPRVDLLKWRYLSLIILAAFVPFPLLP